MTNLQIDPKLVCLACGFHVGSDSAVTCERTGVTMCATWQLCEDSFWMSTVLQRLQRHQPVLSHILHSRWRSSWECVAQRSGARAIGPSPWQAVYALATEIGRCMQVAQ